MEPLLYYVTIFLNPGFLGFLYIPKISKPRYLNNYILLTIRIWFCCHSHCVGFSNSNWHALNNFSLRIFDKYLKLGKWVKWEVRLSQKFEILFTVVSPTFWAVILFDALSSVTYSGSLTSNEKSASSPEVTSSKIYTNF